VVHVEAGAGGVTARVGSSGFRVAKGSVGSSTGLTGSCASGGGRPAIGTKAGTLTDVDAGGCENRGGRGTSGFPRSFSPIFGKSRMTGELYSGNASLKRGWVMFHEWLRAANARL
jgi:hypothetical protein